MISTVIGSLWTISKGLVKRLEDLKILEGAKTIQTTETLTSARIGWKILET